MPITVQFEKPIGTVLTIRQFSPGDKIRVSGKVTGDLGLPNPGVPVTLSITDSFSPIYVESRTNVLGNYWFDITLPNVTSKATVTVSSWYVVGGWLQAIVYIGIGVEPAPEPTPTPQPGLLDTIMMVVVLLVMVMLMSTVSSLMKGEEPKILEVVKKIK